MKAEVAEIGLVRLNSDAYFVAVVVAIAGVASFFSLGQLEDPEFAVKNAVVSVRYPGASPEEIELEVADRIEIAIIYAALSRLRPVALLAAATTVLGVVPLLQDVFWVGLSVTIMAGLSFGTLLTMFLVPVLYSTIYKLRPGGVES